VRQKSYHRKLYQYIVEELGQRIVQGRYRESDVLPTEDQLCEELHVSRGVLREATKVLTQKGLIQVRPKVGTQVQARGCWNLFDPDVLLWQLQVEDASAFLKTVTEVRCIIESEAARLAAMRSETEEVVRIEGGTMIVGILKEIKTEENRVCMTPAGVEVMIHNGHTVLVEKNAGAGSGFADDAYIKAGAKMIDTPKEIFDAADMVMHVKEPLPPEYDLIREGQIVFTYLHLAADETQTNALIKSRSVSIAYETIQKADGSLPLLTPMSEVAGRMAIQQGAKYLEMAQGGHGVLLGGVPGVDPGTVVVIGGGVVGVNAAKMACGLGAKVYLLDMNLDRLRYLSDVMPANCFTLMSSPATIRNWSRKPTWWWARC
jgi:DNA-binding transcriptional regulator YhcF (GntR family)